MMDLLDPLLLARWQFGLTTLYHFLFVPLTLGMALTVAIFQTAWFRTGTVKWLHLTRFFGKIFLINFAMGVVTGIVQEFQFGMNWSAYSRFVGDVFGAPLAFEGLMAFFFEATFIGLWIFGWDKLPRALHLASIWIATIGAWFSAYFILAANAFMQNPVGFRMADDGSRAEMTDFFAVLSNPVALAALPHTLFAAFMMTAGVIISISAWHLLRGQNVEMMRSSLKYGLWGMIVAFGGVALSGDQLSLVMVATQPMKMAAAEAMFDAHAGRMPRSRCSRSARPTARASCSRSACRICWRSCRPIRSTDASKASTTSTWRTRPRCSPSSPTASTATSRPSSGSPTGRSAG